MTKMGRPGFSHEVAFYEDDDEFLDVCVPFVRCGLEADEPILVAVGRRRIELLESGLGEDAAQVRFAEMEELGRNPARIIPAWQDFLDRSLKPGAGAGARGVGEPIWPGRSDAELDECQRHESLLNVAFGAGPPWSLLCPYDSGALDDDVLEAARASHPHLRRDGASEPNVAWGGLEASPFAGSLEPPPDLRMLAFGREELGEVRALVGGEAREAGMREDRATDISIAVGELAANSVLHGGGCGTLRAWREPGALVVEVEDRGRIEEPLVGRLRPTPTQEGGRGLWMANQLCDLVQIRSDPERTAVRIRISLS